MTSGRSSRGCERWHTSMRMSLCSSTPLRMLARVIAAMMTKAPNTIIRVSHFHFYNYGEKHIRTKYTRTSAKTRTTTTEAPMNSLGCGAVVPESLPPCFQHHCPTVRGWLATHCPLLHFMDWTHSVPDIVVSMRGAWAVRREWAMEGFGEAFAKREPKK